MKAPALITHDLLLLKTAETRAAYYTFFNADDEIIKETAEVYKEKLNDLGDSVLALIDKLPREN